MQKAQKMYFDTSQHHWPPPLQPGTCAQGHSTTLILPTTEGGVICLVCLSNLISNPKSPTVHVSYALSQFSHALSQPQFLSTFITFHSHFLVSPLIHSLSSFNDVPIAQQIVDLVLRICEVADDEVYGEFVARVSDRLSSGSLAWSRQQLYTLHCMGVLLDNQKNNPVVFIKDKYALVFNLITGLQFSSEEIQAEALFALYKISLLQDKYKDYRFTNLLVDNCPKLLHLSLEALMKTQSDDVRLNCLALLTVLAQRGWFQNAFLSGVRSKDSFEADNFVQTTEQTIDGPPLNTLFAEAIKGPLLSSDSQVQIATLDLIFLYLSWEGGSGEEIQELVEENIADYVFDILRLSGCKDPLVNSCIQVLDLLSAAEQAFKRRLAIGFTTLLPVLRYVAEVPLHPAQTQLVDLVYNCVSECPGMVSNSHVEEISLILTGMLEKRVDGESGILPGTVNKACSTLVALMKCPSSCGAPNFSSLLRDASRNAVLTCLSDWDNHPEQFLYSLYLLKEAYLYSHDENLRCPFNVELRSGVVDVCKGHLIPWFQIAINSIDEEDIALGVLETFHSLLLQDSDTETMGFIDTLITSSLFSLVFGCLGLFPSEKMKLRVYLMLSAIVDVLLSNDHGQMLRDAALYLPSDPIDLLFLLGQISSHNSELISGQSAVLLILYVSSLYDDRLADDKLVLASLEQYILLNGGELFYGATAPLTMELLINVYGLYRGLAKRSYQIPYSPDAERILFHLVDEKGWDLLSTRIHLISLKWLFQQEKICKSLSEQMLKFCRCNNLEGNHIVVYGQARPNIDVSSIAELIMSGDNFGAMIFVSLLGELVEQDDKEHEIIAVVNTIAEIIEILPAVSDQLSMHGIAVPIRNLYDRSIYSSFPDIFRAISLLVFIFLRSVQSKSLSDDEAWITIVMKLMEYLIDAITKHSWTQESIMVTATLALVLHHSTNEALVEASKIIILSNPLASIISKTISEACSKGPALVDHEEGTRTGEVLIFLLLLIFFSLRSLQTVLPGILEWHDLLEECDDMQPLTYTILRCPDFCKLLHFGSPQIKLISSHCLLELFTRISNHKSRKPDGLKCRRGYLLSVMAVLEGLVFSSDVRISINCSLCLSMLMGWEELDGEVSSVEKNYWCRMMVEELAVSLGVRHLASKSFMIHYKPAVNITVALLKLKKAPHWMTSVFDDSCISGIIGNISIRNLKAELVLLLRELLDAGYLKAEQIASLNRMFQACRKCLYTDETQICSSEKHRDIVAAVPDELRKIREFLINLMSSLSSHDKDLGGLLCSKRQLLAEIELFSKCAMEKHGAQKDL